MVEQVTPAPNPDRAVTHICSPSTYIEETYQSHNNYLCCLYIEQQTYYKSLQEIYSIGVSLIDLSTGENQVYETNSELILQNLSFREMKRFLQLYNPTEIAIWTKNISLTNNEIKEQLGITDTKCHLYHTIESQYFQINYQTQFLQKIFNDQTMLSVIEYLDLEKLPYALLSYLLLLNFAYKHDETIIHRIQKPIIWDHQQHLLLGNNSIHQLNIVSKNKQQKKTIHSLFDIINFTSTPIGCRYLR